MATTQEQNKVCDAAEQVPMVSSPANCDDHEVSTMHSERKRHKEGQHKGFLRSRTMRLSVMLALTSSFFLVELVVGHHLHAMSLIADSFHMLSDVLAITIGLVAIRISKRPSSTHFTFGWKRAEVIGALVNSVFLCALCFSLVIEASQRFFEPEKIKQPLLMLYVGGAGLLINVVGLIILHFGGDVHNHGHSHGHNHAGHNHDDHDHEHGNLGPSDAPSNGKQNHSPCFKSDASNDQLLSLTKEREDSKASVEMRQKHGSYTPTEIDKSPNHGTENELSVPNVVIQMNITDAHKLASIVESQSDGNAADAHNGKGKGSSPAGGHNMRAVFMHVLGDALGSVIVIVSATVVWLVDAEWTMYLDPALSLVIVLIILTGTIPILRDTLRILLETVPRHIRIAELRDAITTIPGVLAIHEFHVWQLQSDVVIASVHVSCASLSEYLRIGPAVKRVFHDFNIHSTTVQPEFIDYQNATVLFDQADNSQQQSLNNERSKDLPGASSARTGNPLQSTVERSSSTQFACTLQCDSDGVCQRQTCCSQPSRAPTNGNEADADAPSVRHSFHSRPSSKVSHSQLEGE